jgi:branched-chain amino acid transport system ATP-binding protein
MSDGNNGTPNGRALLKIEGLNFSYGDFKVLWDLSLEVHEGEIVTVVGSNGAGKSTVLKNISRLVRPDSGSILFQDVDLKRLESHEVAARGIIQVPEGRRIFPELTVLENLRMGSYLKSVRQDREANLERVFALFPRLKERQNQLGGTMSGGEQQMLAIARGLMANPRLLLLDEPSLGLSPMLVDSIFQTIATVNQHGVTILLVEQNVYQALHIANRAYVLANGCVVMTGTGKQLLADQHVRKAFLGM